MTDVAIMRCWEASFMPYCGKLPTSVFVCLAHISFLLTFLVSLLPSVCTPVPPPYVGPVELTYPLPGFLKSLPSPALPYQHSPSPSLGLVQGCSHDPSLSNQSQTRTPVCTIRKEQLPSPAQSDTHKAAVSQSGRMATQGGPAERQLTPGTQC